MEKDAFSSISEFDSYTTTRHLKMLKVSLPFLPVADKGMLYVYIKFSELIHTISIFRKPQTFFPHPKESPVDTNYQMLFSALSSLGDEEETRMFSQLSGIFNAFTMYESYAPLFKMMMEMGGDGMFGGMNMGGDFFGGMNADGPSSGSTDENGAPMDGKGFPSGMDMEKFMNMARMMKQFTAKTDSDSDDKGLQAVEESPNPSTSPEASGINPDMLQAMLSPEQLELFNRFKDNI